MHRKNEYYCIPEMSNRETCANNFLSVPTQGCTHQIPAAFCNAFYASGCIRIRKNMATSSAVARQMNIPSITEALLRKRATDQANKAADSDNAPTGKANAEDVTETLADNGPTPPEPLWSIMSRCVDSVGGQLRDGDGAKQGRRSPRRTVDATRHLLQKSSRITYYTPADVAAHNSLSDVWLTSLGQVGKLALESSYVMIHNGTITNCFTNMGNANCDINTLSYVSHKNSTSTRGRAKRCREEPVRRTGSDPAGHRPCTFTSKGDLFTGAPNAVRAPSNISLYTGSKRMIMLDYVWGGGGWVVGGQSE